MSWLILGGVLQAIVGEAQAGFAGGVLVGADTPIEADTRSTTGPAFGAYLGWSPDTPVVHVQPELTLHVSGSNGTFVPAVGSTLTLGGFLRAGAFAHVGVPVAGGYPFPALDAGALVEGKVLPFTIGARVGWDFASATHLKCGNCAQPADHLFRAELQLGVRF